MSDTRVRLFIAMPGTNMGSSAEWKEPEKIKTHFFAKVAESLQRKLGKPVELVIEKDKVLGGPIHASMFYDAMESDVYIADLTGNNPNVYLELGARWALRDCVTVVVSQNVEEILFNAAASRAIQYSKDPDELENAIEKIIQAILQGFAKGNYCDSPVRKNSDIVAYDRKLIDQIRSEIEQLKTQRGEDLFAAARAAATPEEQLRLLREAARINPSRADILIALGIELRKQAHFDESVAILKQAISLDAKRFESHRELGVTYGKMGKPARAVESLSEAVRLAPHDPETLRNAGGALRRWGLRDAPVRMDWDMLRMARDRYAAAGQLEPHDTYALLNVAKLDLIISKTEPSRLPIAMKQFDDLMPLCQFNITQKPEDPWRRFDLADTHLFSGDHAKAKDFYIDAIKIIKNEYRRSYLITVVGPFHELLAIDALSGDLKSSVEDVAKMIDGLIQTGDCGG
jgi:tetratricopeptide (TPR) repeat protein